MQPLKSGLQKFMEQNYHILDSVEFCSIPQYVEAAKRTMHITDFSSITELGLVSINTIFEQFMQ